MARLNACVLTNGALQFLQAAPCLLVGTEEQLVLPGGWRRDHAVFSGSGSLQPGLRCSMLGSRLCGS